MEVLESSESNEKNKVIPYHLIKDIILNCKDSRTQALIAFQYATGSRAGELARAYTHWKWKSKRKEKKPVKVREFYSEGIRRDQFFETTEELGWYSPNFKNAKTMRKRGWVLKESEEWLYNVLKDWLDKKQGDKYLFSIKHSRIKGLVDAELKKYDVNWSTHCLRHSRATHIGLFVANPYVVKQILGHATLETSTNYVNVALEEIKSKLAGRRFEDVLGKKV